MCASTQSISRSIYCAAQTTKLRAGSAWQSGNEHDEGTYHWRRNECGFLVLPTILPHVLVPTWAGLNFHLPRREPSSQKQKLHTNSLIPPRHFGARFRRTEVGDSAIDQVDSVEKVNHMDSIPFVVVLSRVVRSERFNRHRKDERLEGQRVVELLHLVGASRRPEGSQTCPKMPAKQSKRKPGCEYDFQQQLTTEPARGVGAGLYRRLLV